MSFEERYQCAMDEILPVLEKWMVTIAAVLSVTKNGVVPIIQPVDTKEDGEENRPEEDRPKEV